MSKLTQQFFDDLALMLDWLEAAQAQGDAEQGATVAEAICDATSEFDGFGHFEYTVLVVGAGTLPVEFARERLAERRGHFNYSQQFSARREKHKAPPERAEHLRRLVEQKLADLQLARPGKKVTRNQALIVVGREVHLHWTTVRDILLRGK